MVANDAIVGVARHSILGEWHYRPVVNCERFQHPVA